MYWADRVAKEIIDSGKFKPFWVDDMFTPSGFAHIGSLKGPLVHDLIYKALKHAGQDTTFSFIINDFDPIDGLSQELEKDFSKYLGFPLKNAPSPKVGFDSFADFFADDFKKVLESLGVKPTYYSSWDLYHEGKFDEAIKIALDNAEKIQDIYKQVSGSKKKEAGWLPLQVICEKCGRLGTTRVHDWDGKTVAYTCEKEMIKWAEGCGHAGRISPFGGSGKLPWKVDWPAHWMVLGITIEGAGKDHASAGGSMDIARELCKEVYEIDQPYNFPYEHILIGGKKMASSKGLGFQAREVQSIFSSEVARFLFVRTDYKQSLEFNPVGTMAIPDLFDEYDRCYLSYIENSDDDLAKIFEMSQIGKLPPREKTLLPRFRDIVNYIQMPNVDILKKYEEMKGKKLTEIEINLINERVKYAKIWLEKYAPGEFRMQFSEELPENAKNLTAEQKQFLKQAVSLVEQNNDPEKLQLDLYSLAKELQIETKEAFAAIYIVLIGKDHGPKAGWLILSRDKRFVQDRFDEISSNKISKVSKNGIKIQKLGKPEIFYIDETLKKKFSSMSVGIAVIKGVVIKKTDEGLEKEKQSLLVSLQGLTTEQLGQLPEIVSYRKLYKEMGIDWHSRRPSPEALLRRVVLKKGLYNINTCVDAYNLVVMKNRVSVGAFNHDEIKFPTILRFAKSDEEILLLGDDQPTVYKDSEVAYFDETGGYNIDFNYRDARRTAVQLETKNLYINVDGIYDITPRMIEKVLEETCSIIIKYCGGKVELFGVETK